MNMLIPLQPTSRDWYLEQLGIRQYQLRNPQVFCSEEMLTLSEQTRLILIGEALSLESSFLRDVFASIHLKPAAVSLLKPAQVTLLPDNIPPVIWIMDPIDKMDLTQKSRTVIQTPPLSALMQSAKDKRHLWSQLCNYEHYFRT